MSRRCLLYYITDRHMFGGKSSNREMLLAKIEEAARAGVDYIQLREKDLSASALENLAHEAVALVRKNSLITRILVNSRADVALAVGADGVHLRDQDISAREIKVIWKMSRTHPAGHTADPVVGVSCHSPDDVACAASDGASFAVLAPIFGKVRADDVHPIGLEALRASSKIGIPVLALGGVTLENAGLCLDAGAAGVAGIRLFQENKISDVVRALRHKQ